MYLILEFGRKFRRRFRVPFPLFQFIVSECERVNLFGIKSLSRVRAPLEFKILISLRIVGRGNCFDEIGELAGAFETFSGSSIDITSYFICITS